MADEEIVEQTGNATEAPDEPTEEKGGQEPEGHAEKDPVTGNSEAAPDGEVKTDTPPTKEEIEEWRNSHKRVTDFQRITSTAQQEAADLRKRIADLEASTAAQKTPEQRHAELHDRANAALRNGWQPTVQYDSDHLMNGPQFFMELATWEAEQGAAARAMVAEQQEKATAFIGELDRLQKEHGTEFDKISSALQEHLSDYLAKHRAYIKAMPKEEIPGMVERAIRAVEPKFFNRADMAKATDKIKRINKEAALESTKGKPIGQAPGGSGKLEGLKSKAFKSRSTEDIAAYLAAKAEVSEAAG